MFFRSRLVPFFHFSFADFASTCFSSPLLVLGYTSGFQIWDVSNLSSVTEVLNLNLDNANQDEWGGPGERVVSVALVPQETSSVGRKSLGETVKIGEDGRGLLLGVL